MRTLVCFIFIISVLNLKSQKDNSKNWPKEDRILLEAAKGLYNNGIYSSAYEKYTKLRVNHANDVYLKFLTGICAIHINKKQTEAETLLNEIKSSESDSKNVDYYLALLYHKTYRFSKAIELANKLLSDPKVSADDKAALERIVFYCKNGNNEIQFPVNSKIENLGSLVNTEFAEYAPVVTPEEESVIFTYRGKESKGGLLNSLNKPDVNGEYNEDIFMSKKINGVWQKATGLTELNTIGNDAAISLSPDGKQLFLFKAEGDNGDIYVSKRENGKYGPAEKLKGEVNSNFWEGSLSISTDQKKLYFASNRPGGFGGKDLYVATKNEDGSWGNVKNLGDKINTKYDEDAPFISPDSRILVFSSEGHNSIGDFDLFISDWNTTENTWQAPKNLGYPINTTGDDLFYFLSPDGKRGYFSSARDGGNGDQDLYMVDPALSTKQSYITIIKGKVTENGLSYETEIAVSVAGESKSYSVYKSNGESGNYVVNLPAGKQYKVSFYHEILGDRVYNIDARDVEDYAEKTINVNFGDAISGEIHTSFSKAPATNTSSIGNNTSRLQKEAEIIKKYGSETVEGVTYLIQVAATSTPENYNGNILKNLCKVRDNGAIIGNIRLLVADKTFTDMNSADAFLKKVIAAGQTDAFITGYYKGTRYYIVDLMMLGLWKGKTK